MEGVTQAFINLGIAAVIGIAAAIFVEYEPKRKNDDKNDKHQ